MAEPYKLKDEIKKFIIEKKKINPKLSCRSITPLIKENFGINLSKSTINAIIKENNLSNKVGRPRIRQKALTKPVELLPVVPIILKVIEEIEPQAQIKPAEDIPQSQPIIPVVQEEVKPLEPIKPVELPLEPVVSKAPEVIIPEPALPAEDIPKAQPIGIKSVRENGQSYYIENGGAFFLMIADQKSGLTDFLAGKFAPYMPDLSKDIIRMLIRGRIYSQIFQDKLEPWGFLGKELICQDRGFYYEQLSKIPLKQLDMDFFRLGLEQNINDINNLYKQCLFRLNSLVQAFFFPSVYQFLDFTTMHNRFYALIAKIEVKGGLVDTQLFYRDNFRLVNDIVWQEDFKFVVNKINAEKIFAEGEQFRFAENISLLNMKTVSFR
jgi:hypothetical protein